MDVTAICFLLFTTCMQIWECCSCLPLHPQQAYCYSDFGKLNFQKQSPGGSLKKGILKIFAKFIGKHLCRRLLFYKVKPLRPTTLVKMGFQHRCFDVNFLKVLKTPFFAEHIRWLLLNFVLAKQSQRDLLNNIDAEVQLRSLQTSTMKPICKNTERLKLIN